MNRSARWASYVDGRSVAIVGPAHPVGDQTSEIDAHDIVVRFHYTGRHQVHEGTGSRTNVAYYNRSFGRRMRSRLTHGVARLDWLCFVDQTHAVGAANCRAARRPELRRPNMVPWALNDLTIGPGRPTRITVYCANFYADERPYRDPGEYLPARLSQNLARTVAWTVSAHDQNNQRRFIRELIERHPYVSGDQRFVDLLALDNDEFDQLINSLHPQGHYVPKYRRPVQPMEPRQSKLNAAHIYHVWRDPNDATRIRKVVAKSTKDERYRNAQWLLVEVFRPDGVEPVEPVEPVADLDSSTSSAGPDDERQDEPAAADDEHGDERQDEPATGADAWSVWHVGAGTYAIAGPDGAEIDRARGRAEAEQLRDELRDSHDERTTDDDPTMD